MYQEPEAKRVPSWTVRSGKDLGHALSEIRRQAGKTQAELAADVGLSRVYLAQIEAGRTVSLLEHLIRALQRSGARLVVQLPEDDGQASST